MKEEKNSIEMSLCSVMFRHLNFRDIIFVENLSAECMKLKYVSQWLCSQIQFNDRSAHI